MKKRLLQLSEKHLLEIVKLPQNGTASRVVKIFTKEGKIFRMQKVVNSEFLLLDDQQKLHPDDIESIELENVDSSKF